MRAAHSFFNGMTTALHHRLTPQPNLRAFLLWSFAFHLIALVLLSFSLSKTLHIAPSAPLQVKLVGTPQPTPATKPVVPEKIRTQDSAAPKEPPPTPKDLPDSEAKSKFALDQKQKADDKKVNLVAAQKRPPVLDKTPDPKKVVKNDKDAKVVKNPDDFLKSLDFVDKLPDHAVSKTTVKPKKQDKAGEGPVLQLNLADEGTVDGIRDAIQKNWLVPPGMETDKLTVSVEVKVNAQGEVQAANIETSSGNQAFDNSLLRAVRRASPLPLPTGNVEKFATLDLEFAGGK